MSFEKNEMFDLNVVLDQFKIALRDEDDVQLQPYLDSYEELNKFFLLMGSVFGFVSKDLRAKIDILMEFLVNDGVRDKFKTVKRMIEYERDSKLLAKQGYVSGSRTLLRLHRGLDFIRVFLKKVAELRDEESAGAACREAYDSTLAKHHPFMVRTGAQIAMYMLPTRAILLTQVCGEEGNVKQAVEILPKTLEAMNVVFERVDALYTAYDLHRLP